MPSLAPRHGGPTEAALGMVRALRRIGVDSRLLSSDDDLGGRLAVPLNEWTEHEGVPTFFLPRVTSRQHTLIGFTFTPGFSAWCRRHMCEFDFAHIHTVFSHPANVAMAAARRLRVPYAVRPLGQLCDWSLRQRAWIKRLQLALVTRRNINGAAFLHVTSAMEAEETMRNGFRCPVLVQPHGLDLPPVHADARETLRRELRVPSYRTLAIFLSRLHPKKGLEILFEAMARQQRKDFDLVVAGTGEDSYVASLHALVERLGLAARVHWTGFVTGDPKWHLLQGGDLFVLPSHSENFGIVVVEALACGLPVVVSTEVALAEEIRRHHLGLVASLGAQAVADAMDQLLANPAERADIARRARSAVAENFTWDAAALALAGRYQDAVEHRAAAH